MRGASGGRDEVRRAAVLQYTGYLEAQQALARARRLDGDAGEAAAELDEVLRRATDVERSVVLADRRAGRVSAASADEVLRDIESRTLRDLG